MSVVWSHIGLGPAKKQGARRSARGAGAPPVNGAFTLILEHGPRTTPAARHRPQPGQPRKLPEDQ